MSKKSINFPQYLSVLVFVFSFFICSNTFAQNRAANEQLSINSFKSISDSESSAPERPRIVSKVNNTENSAKVGDEKSKDKSSDSASLLLRFEQQAFEILNFKRAENGLPPLRWNDGMAKIARSHSQDMAEYHYFSHAGRNGSMVNDRADILGLSDWQAIGENIAFNRGFEKPVEFACEGWMKSPAHRDNILNSRWKEAGIGVAIAVDGSYYFTEVFMLR